MAFDIEGAKKAGYTDAEIADHLAKQSNFDLSGAKKAGYNDAEILQHLTAAPAGRSTAADAIPQGRSGSMREAFTRPADISNVPVQTLSELGGRYKNIGIGAGQGALAAIPGLPGDVLSLAVDNPFTSEKIGNAMFGEAATPDVRAGRMLGNVVTGFGAPVAAAKLVGPLKTMAETAGLAKTGKALGLAQTVLDPVPAMLQGATTVGGKAYNAMQNAANYAIAPGVTAENRLARMVADPAAAAAAMRNTENIVTSGGPVSVSERLAAGNVAEPRIAAAQEALSEGKLAPQVQAAQQERIAAIQSNIQNVERELAQNVNAMTPAKADELRVVRDGYLRSLAEAQAEATAAGGQIAGRIPNPNQMEIGQSLAERAAIGSREATSEVISPAFKDSFKLAGDTPIVINNVLRNAQELAGTERAMTDASTVSEGIRSLRKFEAPPQPGVPGAGGRGGYSDARNPAQPGTSSLTLEQFQDIRSTLSGELRDVRSLPAGTPDKATRERFLKNTLQDMDAALAQSAISPEARAAYERARGLQITEKVEPFGTGVTAQLNQRGLNNVPQILPEEAVAAFAKSESPATQYGVSFARDPAAARDMAEGFSGLFRRVAIGEDGLVDAAAASKFIREHSPQLDVLEKAGVRVRDQLTDITTEAARNARQREALTAESTKFSGAQDAKSLADLALNSASDMDTVRRRLTPDARAALGAEVKNRALDVLKASNPDAAIEYLTSKKKAIEVALGKTGEAEHAAMLNAAKMQKRLMETRNAVPNTGLYDPAVLQAKFTRSQLADLKVANAEIARVKQMGELAKTGGNARVVPAPASWNDFVTSINPLVWLRTAVAKFGKNFLDSRVNAEAFRVMYENPERFTAALDRAMAQTKRGETAREAASTIARPLTITPTLTINRLAPPQENRNSMAR
jgi:hypothetical protein